MESAESLDKNFKAEMLQDGPSDGMFTAKLVIKTLTEEIAKSDMRLEVSNALGTTFYPFKLSLGEKPAPGETDLLVTLTLPDTTLGGEERRGEERRGVDKLLFIFFLLSLKY